MCTVKREMIDNLSVTFVSQKKIKYDNKRIELS